MLICFIDLKSRLWKRHKMLGKPCILSLFHNKFNNAGAWMLDSVYHTLKSHFWCENFVIVMYVTLLWTSFI